jgi:hypothetical protein
MQHKEGRFKSVCIAHYNLFVKAGFIIHVKINANNCLCSAEGLVLCCLQNTPCSVRTVLLLLKSCRRFCFPYLDICFFRTPSKVKAKQSHYSPWQALWVPGDWGFHISRQSSHEGGKVVSPKDRPLLPPRNINVFVPLRGWVKPKVIVRPEGLCQKKFQWHDWKSHSPSIAV